MTAGHGPATGCEGGCSGPYGGPVEVGWAIGAVCAPCGTWWPQTVAMAAALDRELGRAAAAARPSTAPPGSAPDPGAHRPRKAVVRRSPTLRLIAWAEHRGGDGDGWQGRWRPPGGDPRWCPRRRDTEAEALADARTAAAAGEGRQLHPEDWPAARSMAGGADW